MFLLMFVCPQGLPTSPYWGVSDRGDLCSGRGSVPGGGGACIKSPGSHCSGHNASYWNAFLLLMFVHGRGEATAVVGALPTGMHSCYKLQEKLFLSSSYKTGVHHAAFYNVCQFLLDNRKLNRKHWRI